MKKNLTAGNGRREDVFELRLWDKLRALELLCGSPCTARHFALFYFVSPTTSLVIVSDIGTNRHRTMQSMLNDAFRILRATLKNGSILNRLRSRAAASASSRAIVPSLPAYRRRLIWTFQGGF